MSGWIFLFYSKPQIPDNLYPSFSFLYRKTINQPFKEAKQDFFFLQRKQEMGHLCSDLPLQTWSGCCVSNFEDLTMQVGGTKAGWSHRTWEWLPLTTQGRALDRQLHPGLCEEFFSKPTHTKEKNLLCYLIFTSLPFLK